MTRGVVVDTSAAAAILTSEPTATWLRAVLDDSDDRYMTAPTYLELAIVLESRLGPAASGIAARLVRDGRISIVPVDHVIAERALEGWRRFGKGRHPAALNYGDCFTYGLAVELGAPILCTGDDFARTDAAVVAPPPVPAGT